MVSYPHEEMEGRDTMAQRKLLIADKSEEFRYALAAALREEFQILHCGTGPEALEALRSFRPDVLVLDLMIPGLDGISLLHTSAEEGICPAVLATVSLPSKYIDEAAALLGVSYLLVKPCNIRATAQRIREINLPIHSPKAIATDPRKAVSELLLSLGFSTKLRGYTYAREAILLLWKNPDQSMTKELYPAIAHLCDTNSKQVEHCIRTAIEKAWLRRDNRIWQHYFLPSPDGTIPKPSNAVFLSLLANSLTLQQP